MFAHKLMSKTN